MLTFPRLSVSTLLAFSLDIYVRQRSHRRGAYLNMTPIDAKGPTATTTAYPAPPTAGVPSNDPFSDPPNPFSDHNAASTTPKGESPYANRMPSPYLRSPNDPEGGAFSHDAHAEERQPQVETKSPIDYFKAPFTRQGKKDDKGAYELPDEQFKYDDDTEYRGKHGDPMS